MSDYSPEDYTTDTYDEETTISANDDEVVTVTQEEIDDLVKKQITECATEFKTMKEDEIIDLFADVSGLGSGLVPLARFDFREYNAAYYRQRFPNFPLEFYDLMEKASKEKIANFAKKDIWPDENKKCGIRVNEERTISFGKPTTVGEPEPSLVDTSELEDSDLSDLDHMSLHPSGDLRPPALARSENEI